MLRQLLKFSPLIAPKSETMLSNNNKVFSKGNYNYYEPFLIIFLRLGDSFVGALLFGGLHRVLGLYSREITIGVFFLSMVFFTYSGVYQSWRMGSLSSEINRIIATCIFIYLVFIAFSFFFELSNLYSRKAVAIWIVLWPSLLAFQRISIRKVLRYFRKKGRNIKHAIIIGDGELGGKIKQWIENNPWSGMLISGFFHDNNLVLIEGCKRLGDYKTIGEYIEKNKVDIAYILIPLHEKDLIQKIVAVLSNSTCSIYLVPDIYDFGFNNRIEVGYFGELPVFSLIDSHVKGFNGLMKRSEDIILSSLILILITPIMSIIALGVKLTSPGPVIFTQWRYGLNGSPIKIHKFRTMNVCEDGIVFEQATMHDPRVTKFGSFLRKYNLDELPQFLNVIQGRMSIVGPRPHAVAMNEKYRKLVSGYMLRHKIKPGITGLAQINGCRGATDTLDKVEKRLRFDLEYLTTWSLLLDMKIIVLTIIKEFRGQNAY